MESGRPFTDPARIELTGAELTGDPQIDGALRRLGDPDRDVRHAAALDLGTIAAPAAAQALVARLGFEQDFYVRDTLSWALTRIPDAAMPLLLGALTRTDTGSRVQVLHVLSKIADPATTKTIMMLTADTDPAVAAKARWALTRIADPIAVPALAVHLGAGDSTSQNDLTRDLASFGTAALPLLLTALTNDQAPVRRHAAEVLCFMGPEAESATDALAQALQDTDDEVRLCAAMALYEVGAAEAREILSHHTEANDPRLRAIARRSQIRAAGER